MSIFADTPPPPAHYGSAAGELAVLVQGVGIADRSRMAAFELTAPVAVLQAALADLADIVPAVGGATVRGETWWCAVHPGRVVVLGEPATAERLRGRLDWHLAHRPALRVRDLSAEYAVLAVLGERARELLAALGVYGDSGDPRCVPPVRAHPVAGADALWVLRSDRDALAIVRRSETPAVWRGVLAAGRPLRISAVGHEAVARYALTRRRAAFA